MKLNLVAIDPDLVSAWKAEFSLFPEVSIIEADIFSVAKDTIVSPGNSYGYMDGGLDRLLIDFFGLQLQQKVRDIIYHRPEGYLPVGSAVLVNTNHQQIPHLIYAPTMFLPEAIPPTNCFFTMTAILKKATEYRHLVKEFYCPGLGTGIGQVPPSIAAREMANAYSKFASLLNKNDT